MKFLFCRARTHDRCEPNHRLCTDRKDSEPSDTNTSQRTPLSLALAIFPLMSARAKHSCPAPGCYECVAKWPLEQRRSQIIEMFAHIDQKPFALVKIWIDQIHLRMRKITDLGSTAGTRVLLSVQGSSFPLDAEDMKLLLKLGLVAACVRMIHCCDMKDRRTVDALASISSAAWLVPPQPAGGVRVPSLG